MTIEFKAKNVYGLVKYYPTNEAAECLAAIAGTKTLTEETLRLAEKIGLEVLEVN